ncbi:MAG: speB [Bacillales bacterium]|jgi:agmatinase|nr:speB [Bacillales bacterium]
MYSKPNIGFNECEYEGADLVVVGLPFDSTTSFRPGTRFASSAIRNEFIGIESYSPLLDEDLEEKQIYDMGDIELPFGQIEKSLDSIHDCVSKIYSDHKIPFAIGGEHLVSLPLIKAAFEKYPDLVVIHLDAHTDLRDHYLGNTLSHASVMKRCHEFLGDGKIYQFGIRSGTKEEFQFANKGHVQTQKFNLDGLTEILNLLNETPVYVTVDLDVLDPSIFPGTGTPEAGGVTYKELEQLFVAMKGKNIVGADIVELSPHYDHSGVSTAVACKVLREMILAILKNK